MKSKKHPDYSDQWNIKPNTNSLQEARACLLYEFARESETLIRWVDQYRENPKSADDFGGSALLYIQNVSLPLARMVAAMGRDASLAKPWCKIKRKLQRKLAMAAYPALRYASEREILKSLEKNPSWKNHRQFRDPLPVQPDELSTRILSLVVDASHTTSELKKQLGIFLKNEIAPTKGGSLGRGATGLESVKKQIKNLELMRLLSSRDFTQARQRIREEGSKLLDAKSGGDGGISKRIRGAQTTFYSLFPSLFNNANAEMISHAAYKIHHPGGRPQKPLGASNPDTSAQSRTANKKGAVFRAFKKLTRNRPKSRRK